MFFQESKSALSVDAVAALKKFDFSLVLQAQLRVKPAGFPVFVAHPGIRADAIEMAAFDHEWPRQYEVGHFGVIKSMTEIPVRHLPFDGAHEAKGFVRGGDFMRPLIEITGAD